MNLMDLRTPFPEADIEWRVSQCGKNQDGTFWALCVAYVSARAVEDRLDQVCGPENWKVSYRKIEASDRFEAGFIAVLEIRVDGEWIAKEDGAEQTDFESFKGGISSALKRAGVAWGIGRYLYDLDATFAKTSKAKAPGYRHQKTKDFAFYWEPPKLPASALPTAPSGQKKQAEQKPQAPAQSDTSATEEAPSKPKSRSELIASIMKAAESLNCSKDELTKWVFDTFKKKTKDLNAQELGQFLEILQGEIGRKGEVA